MSPDVLVIGGGNAAPMVRVAGASVPPISGALHAARTNALFMCRGKALVNAYQRSAEPCGPMPASREAQDRKHALHPDNTHIVWTIMLFTFDWTS